MGESFNEFFYFGATLPHWIGSLISLTELGVHECRQLKSLPKEMRSLKNLQKFYIWDSQHLEKICRQKTGEDWPRIAHIPHIDFYTDQ